MTAMTFMLLKRSELPGTPIYLQGKEMALWCLSCRYKRCLAVGHYNMFSYFFVPRYQFLFTLLVLYFYHMNKINDKSRKYKSFVFEQISHYRD